MKISTKGRYGLRALVDLAAQREVSPISLSSVAERQNLSLNYMEQVFGTLRKAGIVNSVKGPSGGYMLARKADVITVKEVLETLEGTFSIVDGERGEAQRDPVQMAIESLVWSQIDKHVNEFLEQKTIQDIVEEHLQLAGTEQLMYYI